MININILDITTLKDSFDETIWHKHAVAWNGETMCYEPYFVLCSRKPLNNIGFDYKILDFNSLDKTKSWFLNLVPHNNFFNTEPKDIYEKIPSELIDEINNGKGYLIINNENEYDTYKFFRKFYENFRTSKYINPKKIFLLSAGSLAKDQYDMFCADYNIKQEEKVNILYSPHMNVLFTQADLDYFSSFTAPSERNKKFTVFNREFRYHRPAFVSLLSSHGLLEHGYVSLGANQQKMREFENQGGAETHLKKFFSNYNIPPNVQTLLNQGIEQIAPSIPICLDKTEFETNYAPYNFTPVEMMLDSYFHITSCTHYFDWQEPSPGWHEKEWKPILIKQPFIMLGRPGMLKLMRRFGFLTFSRWFDESYDEIENDWHRMLAIVKEIERLSKISNQEWDKMIEEMRPMLEYNYQVLLHKKYDLFFHVSDLKNIIEFL